MDKLERLLASGVLNVLRERAHVALAPTRADALRDELEAMISPAVTMFVNDTSARTTRGARSSGARKLGRTNANSSSGVEQRAQAMMTQIAEQVSEHLLQSDHVDDVFASDGVIRRDALRVLHQLLSGYLRGEIDVERTDHENTITIPLLDLGYLVAEVSKRLDVGMLQDALERGVATLSGRLIKLSRQRIASFELVGRAETSRLALEEAVTHELVALIEAELVELPSIEKVLELADVDCLSDAFELAIQQSVTRTRSEFDCTAHCVAIDENTVIATLTPMSAHAADHADNAFTLFLETLEEELISPSRKSELPESRPGGAAVGAAPGDTHGSGAHGSGADGSGADGSDAEPAPNSRPASSRRKRTTEQEAPPRSRPRGKRPAPRAATSSTRQMRIAKKRKRAK